MTITLGAYTLSEPDAGYEGFEEALVDVGAFHELADGSIAYDYVGNRRNFTLRWTGLTATEKNTARSAYNVKTEQTFIPPNGGTYTVLVMPSTWRIAYVEDSDGNERWRVEFKLSTVT